LGPDAPNGAFVVADTSDSGRVSVSFQSPTALSAGPAKIVTIIAEVPFPAPYGAAHVLDVSISNVNGGSLFASADDAVHVVALPGDATGNRVYSGLDAQRIARVAVNLDTGFDAFPNVDPLVIGDVTGDGTLGLLDAQSVAQETVGLHPEEIPRLSQPLRLSQLPAATSVSNTPDTKLLRGPAHCIIDPPRIFLSLTNDQTVPIDVHATGCGWIVDTIPWDKAGLAQTSTAHNVSLLARISAEDRAELLTALMHELGCVLGYDQSDDFATEDSVLDGARLVWEDGSLLDVPADLCDVLSVPRLTPPVIDDYFAAK
jgi:hypothetical protein